MERVMSVEERIKRAEDRYNKRNGNQISQNYLSNIKHNKKHNVKRLFLQIYICLLIYIVFYAVTNREYVFSQEFRNEVKLFFTEKTKIIEWYNGVKSQINSVFDGEETKEDNNEKEVKENNEVIEYKKSEEVKQEEAKNSEESKQEETNNKEDTKTEENIESKEEKISDENNIGGSLENNKEQIGCEQELTEEEKMVKIADEIKSNISFIVPIHGRISSTFGWRNPTTKAVPKYHTGIDIAANEGTIIKSATDGKVIVASTKGDFGKHYQIQIEDIIIIYAHCKKLYLKEGDVVKQGQNIGEVGSTGNSTGPHLHFEIRKGEIKIDPQLIINI